MTVQVYFFPLLILIAIVLAAIVHKRTKSWLKVGYALEIMLAAAVLAISAQLTDMLLITAIDLLALGLLINGIVCLAKKK
jgi:hypothetical protein